MDIPDLKYLLERLDFLFENLKREAKLNVSSGFVLKNVDDGSCRYFYAHDNFTLLGRSKLEATTEDLIKKREFTK